MKEKCTAVEISKNCNPCAYIIAFLFQKYEIYVEETIESLFTSISKKTAEILTLARKDALGETSTTANV